VRKGHLKPVWFNVEDHRFISVEAALAGVRPIGKYVVEMVKKAKESGEYKRPPRYGF
jgi:hypothetical protein